MSIQLESRPATAADYDFTRGVYFETQKWIIDQLFGWDEARETEKFLRQFKPEQTQILYSDGKPIGWLSLAETEDAIEILNLHLVPMHQKRGIGTQILQTLLQRARAEKKAVLFSAARINKSKKLFERLGFYTTHEEIITITCDTSRSDGPDGRRKEK